jgi:hypothetical protein
MTKFDDEELKKKIIFAVSKGATFQLACDYAGITYHCFRLWMEEGKKQALLSPDLQDDYFKFFKEVKKAQGLMALQCLDRIEQAGKSGNWTADAWKLERIHAKYYSRDSATLEFNERLEALENKGGNDEIKRPVQNSPELDSSEGKGTGENGPAPLE